MYTDKQKHPRMDKWALYVTLPCLLGIFGCSGVKTKVVRMATSTKEHTVISIDYTPNPEEQLFPANEVVRVCIANVDIKWTGKDEEYPNTIKWSWHVSDKEQTEQEMLISSGATESADIWRETCRRQIRETLKRYGSRKGKQIVIVDRESLALLLKEKEMMIGDIVASDKISSQARFLGVDLFIFGEITGVTKHKVTGSSTMGINKKGVRRTMLWTGEFKALDGKTSKVWTEHVFDGLIVEDLKPGLFELETGDSALKSQDERINKQLEKNAELFVSKMLPITLKDTVAVSSSANLHCEKGVELLHIDPGNWQEAITQFDSALLENGQDYHAWFGKGLAYELGGHYENALKTYKSALAYVGAETSEYAVYNRALQRAEFREEHGDYQDSEEDVAVPEGVFSYVGTDLETCIEEGRAAYASQIVERVLHDELGTGHGPTIYRVNRAKIEARKKVSLSVVEKPRPYPGRPAFVRMRCLLSEQDVRDVYESIPEPQLQTAMVLVQQLQETDKAESILNAQEINQITVEIIEVLQGHGFTVYDAAQQDKIRQVLINQGRLEGRDERLLLGFAAEAGADVLIQVQVSIDGPTSVWMGDQQRWKWAASMAGKGISTHNGEIITTLKSSIIPSYARMASSDIKNFGKRRALENCSRWIGEYLAPQLAEKGMASQLKIVFEPVTDYSQKIEIETLFKKLVGAKGFACEFRNHRVDVRITSPIEIDQLATRLYQDCQAVRLGKGQFKLVLKEQTAGMIHVALERAL